MLGTVVAVVAGGALAMWLLGVWSHVPAKVSESDKFRLDEIKLGLTVAAGLAAGVTLLVTLRRQVLHERTQRFAEKDAVESRITALYVAAADQLGSDKPAVRLAGLYSLERLGQDHPPLRQTVVDVICAYLRMPYTPPIEFLPQNVEQSPSGPADDAAEPDEDKEAERRQELQVRLTAQRLLAKHLRPRTDSAQSAVAADWFWRGPADEWMDIDLTGAALVKFDFSDCHLGHFAGEYAQFYASTDLNKAQFHAHAEFDFAEFYSLVFMYGVQFHAHAGLHKARFHSLTDLSRAQFRAGADLREAQFQSKIELIGASFQAIADLSETKFGALADLRKVQFHSDALFSMTEFHAKVDLGKAQFYGYAGLSHAQFQAAVDLSGTRFHQLVDLTGAQFYGDAVVNGNQPVVGLKWDGALVARGDWLPIGWTVNGPSSDVNGLRRVTREEAPTDTQYDSPDKG
ncbi:pentapeptide repeat-containing protein [Actinoplanes sp. NPDC051633]|uniref:pentapeptide repeat-containing protein n=1 Tax=Actinoplanes sp. NPDC051633 TaxID=3155670 RepID=UPI003438BA3B